jgi:NIPSNAP
MKTMFLSLAVLFAGATLGLTAEKETRVFELRVYTANKGKQAAVTDLIAKSGTKYMAKHSIELLGVWVPLDAADERVVMLVAHPDKATGETHWAAFQADEGWKTELADASKDGRAVAGIARFFLSATDYSPAIKPGVVGDRVFELRTYASSPENLGNLNARFRNHTVKLFEKHGMTNVSYFNFLDGEKTTAAEMLKGLSPLGKDAAEVKDDVTARSVGLVYFITHKSPDAMKASFDKFRVDEEWKAVVAASEKVGGGPLTAKNGVKSLLLKPTDFSPTK